MATDTRVHTLNQLVDETIELAKTLEACRSGERRLTPDDKRILVERSTARMACSALWAAEWEQQTRELRGQGYELATRIHALLDYCTELNWSVTGQPIEARVDLEQDARQMALERR